MIKPNKLRFQTTLSTSDPDEIADIEECTNEKNKYTIVGMFRMGLAKAKDQIRQGEDNDKRHVEAGNEVVS